MQAAMSRRRGMDLSLLEVRLALMNAMDSLGIDRSFMDRHLNEGFSGGEKKRNEILQMALLEPDIAILDEADSGLDIDALHVVAAGIRKIREQRPAMACVLITHYERLLEQVRPDCVHVLVGGRIVASGDAALAGQIDAEGYATFEAAQEIAAR
jgi:Fe-S cluster assembly ATP-binding protein